MTDRGPYTPAPSYRWIPKLPGPAPEPRERHRVMVIRRAGPVVERGPASAYTLTGNGFTSGGLRSAR